MSTIATPRRTTKNKKAGGKDRRLSARIDEPLLRKFTRYCQLNDIRRTDGVKRALKQLVSKRRAA